MPHVTGRGGPEVRVVVSGQRQGQVYLCDATNLGSSARCRHHVSEGRSGRSDKRHKKITAPFSIVAGKTEIRCVK